MSMNGAHLHLMVNHFPIVGIQLALIALLIAYFKKSDDGLRLSFILFIIAGFSAIPTVITGGMAEEVVETFHKLTGGAHLHGGAGHHEAIEEHEEAAEVAVFLAVLCGVLGAAGIFLKQKARLIALVLIIAGVIATAQLGVVANLGGEIHHPELKLHNGVLPLGGGHSHESGESAEEEAREHSHGGAEKKESQAHAHGTSGHSASGGHAHGGVSPHHDGPAHP